MSQRTEVAGVLVLYIHTNGHIWTLSDTYMISHYLEHEEYVLDIWTHLSGEQHLVEGVEVVELAGHEVTDVECSGAGLLLPGQVL